MTASMIEGLNALINFMVSQAQAGDEVYRANLQAERHHGYLANIGYTKQYKKMIQNGLVE